MKSKYFFILLIILISFLSCKKKNGENISQSENEINSLENNNNYNKIYKQEINSENDDYLKYYELIMEYEGENKYPNERILYIKEIKYDIKNSRNLFVLWTDIDGSTDNELIQTIYIINENNEIINRYWFLSALNPKAINKRDLFKKVAGERYNDIECFVINDFNNNGLDEILFYCYGSAGDENKYFYIEIIDVSNITERKPTIFSLWVPFDFNDDFIPIEYCTINGISGFKIYTKVENSVSKWFFYTWNEEEQKYLVNETITF
jgi:hypothetical protein